MAGTPVSGDLTPLVLAIYNSPANAATKFDQALKDFRSRTNMSFLLHWFILAVLDTDALMLVASALITLAQRTALGLICRFYRHAS